jgi:hypothetical protein
MRYQKAESTYLVASFSTGKTVTITIYKLSDVSVVVNAAPMTEIGSTGMFKYLAALAPSVATEYLWLATDGYDQRAGKIVLGGYPDTLATSQAAEEGDIATIQGDVATIMASQAGEEADIGTITASQAVVQAAIEARFFPELSGHSWSDIMVDAFGEPLCGVLVECYSDYDYTNFVTSDETDDLGAITLYVEHAGTYYLRAAKAGMATSMKAVVIA